jgi:hypothetical protein
VTARPAARPRAALLLLLLVLLADFAAAPAASAADRRDGGGGPPTPRETVEKVIEVLGRPEFAGSEEEEEGLLLILANMLSDFVDAVKRLRRTNRTVYWTIVGWLASTLLVIVGHVAWTVWRGGAGAAAAEARRPSAADPALATRAGRDPERMLAGADGAAAAGRHAEGVPWLYLALLFRLERAGRVEFDPARTGLEYADALARRPSDRTLWTGFLDRHDPVVFGARPCPPGEFEEMRRLASAPLPEETRAGGP